MTKAALAALPLLAAPIVAADEWACSPEAIHREITGNHPVSVATAAEIPPEVLGALHLRAEQLANPGEPWNAGCVQDKKTPGASLVFAAHTARVWVVYTLHGGIALFPRLSAVCKDHAGWTSFSVQEPPQKDRDPSAPRTRKQFETLSELQATLQPDWIRPVTTE